MRRLTLLSSFLLALPFLPFQLWGGQGLFISDYVDETDAGDDGTIDFRQVSTVNYDVHGNVSEQNVTAFGSDGKVEELDRFSWVYDKHGNPLSETDEIDFSGNGTIDWRSTTSFKTLAPNETEEFSVVDWDGDGVPDYTVTDIRMNNDQGEPLSEVQEYDYGTNFPPVRLLTTWTYDYANHQIFRLEEADRDGDEVLDETEETITIVDDRHRPLSSVTTVSDSAVLFSPRTETYTYDKHGNLLRYDSDYEVRLPDPVPYHDTVTYSYEHKGEAMRDTRQAGQGVISLGSSRKRFGATPH